MGDALLHRGPDDFGTWCDDEAGLAFAHTRLAIIDTSNAGHQPMASHDARFVICYNGEVYNHIVIRAELEASGAAPQWRGDSDTETILAAVSAWGVVKSLQEFSGMFAFGLWDRKLKRLYVCRDRVGEKPLYYGWLGDTFVFGSELKAIRRHHAWTGELDRGALTLFMRYNYIPAPYSIYRGIRKLPPGSVLHLDLGCNEPHLEPYWSANDLIEQAVSNPFEGDDIEAVEELERLLRRATLEQMIADVPLGAFLSGGIDSSTIVALMQAQSARPISTFTVGFSVPEFNEAEHAKAVAKHLGTHHSELYVSPSDVIDVVPRTGALYDEPFADPSQIPTYLVSKYARQSVTVALSGDGGDELFSGYDRYRRTEGFLRRWDGVPRLIRRGIVDLASVMSPESWDKASQYLSPAMPRRWRSNFGSRLYNLCENLDLHPSRVYHQMLSHSTRPAQIVLGGSEPLTAFTDPDRHCHVDSFSQFMMALDFLTYLPDDILVKVDRAAMAVGLETRVPLLNLKIIRFAWSLPDDMKFRAGQSKWVLRQVLQRYVPAALFERPKKGFSVPLREWLRGPLRDWAEALLAEDRVRREGILNADMVQSVWRQLKNGMAERERLLWNILMFQSWLEAANSRTGATAPPFSRLTQTVRTL